jgi:hypothetical protein
MKNLRRIRQTFKTGAVTLACAVLAASVAAACTTIAHGLSNQPKFTITNTISSSATTQTAALLYPGVPRYLWYTAHNPLSVPITVRSMTIASVTPPAGCSTTNLNYASTAFTGSLVIPARGTNSAPVPISLFETHTNQDSCENKLFGFTFQGTATYSVVSPTKTQLSSSRNPSAPGQTVTYSALIISGDGTGNHGAAPSPTGSVTFYDGSTVICANVPVVAGPNNTSSATCTPPAYAVVGAHPISALFTNSDGNFADSNSSILEQIVASGRKSSTALTSWPNPSVVGFPVALIASVFPSPPVPPGPTPSGIVTFYTGIPGGTHISLGTETLDATGKATLTTSTLPVGADNVYAVFAGNAIYSSSTSPVLVQVVVAKPSRCSDTYDNWFYGSPGSSNFHGSSGNDFFWAPNGSYSVWGSNANNCFWGGDGNDTFSGGDGHDVVTCGNGSNTISLGNGDDSVLLGDGTNQITLGSGNDSVVVGNGNKNRVIVGNGNDVVTIGSGGSNQISLGSGTDEVTLQGSGNAIASSNGNDTIFLGAGTANSYSGGAHQHNLCHLPTPPAAGHGSPAAYYHDTLTNCTVVSP